MGRGLCVMGCVEDPSPVAPPPPVTQVPSPAQWSPDLAGPVGRAGGAQGWRALACWGPRR